MVGSFPTYAFAVYQKQHILSIHALIRYLRHLTHRIIPNLQTRQFVLQQSFDIHLDSIKENEYCFPLPGGKVISAYGARRGHSGTDIKTKANDTIRCAFDGIVRMAKTYAAYGNVVVVRHDNGLESIL